MRILITTDTVGGVWTFTRELAGYFLQQGCSVTLVSFGAFPSPQQQSSMDLLTSEAPKHFCYEASSAPLEWMPDNLRAYREGETVLTRICRQFLPDALLSSQFCYGALAVDCPKVVIAHSDVLSWASATGTTLAGDDGWLSRYRTLVQRGLSACNTVVAPTACMLHDLSLNFRVPSKRAVIPNGRLVPVTRHGQTRRMQTVTAGRMRDQAKNLEMLYQIRSPMILYVAGESGSTGPPDSGVVLLGLKSEADLLELFRSSAAYLCTSTYEPFGLAPLEAALCGCAVLAHDIPSLREVWGDGALYFSSAAHASSLLQHLHDDKKILEDARTRSYDRASTYTVKQMGDSYFELLKGLLEQNGRSHLDAA